jgi:4-amino-4-deoxy-L-arabinose transferase-like glycosyltransferase
MALVMLPSFGRRIVSTTDEARFVLYAREVLAHRALFDVRIRGKLFREKPPLYAWTIAALSIPGGRVTEATAQAPVALAGIVAAIFTCLLGDRMFNRRVGVWSGLVLATTAGFFWHSHLLLPDMLVLAFSTAAAYWFWRAAEDPPGRGARVLFYGALALAVYAKGPLGLLPLLVGAIWLCRRSGWRGMITGLWSPTGLALFGGITLTWLLPFLALGSGTFAGTVLWDDWLKWYGGGPGRQILRVAREAAGFFLPWAMLVPLVLPRALDERRTPAVSYALLSFVVPLLAVGLSAHFRTRYLLPAAPGFALLVGWWADANGAKGPTTGRLIGWASLLAMGLLSAGATLPILAGLRRSLGVPEPSLALAPIILAGWGIGFSLWAGLRTGHTRLVIGGVTAGMVILLSYGTWVAAARFDRGVDIPRLADRLASHAHAGEAGVFNETGWLEIDYYFGHSLQEIRTIPDLENYLSHDDRPVLASETSWQQLQRQTSPRIRVLERVRAHGKTFVILGWAAGPPISARRGGAATALAYFPNLRSRS